MFPIMGNEENTGDKTQGEKGGTSFSDVNSLGHSQEHGDLSKNTTSVKRGHEPILDAIIATPI